MTNPNSPEYQEGFNEPYQPESGYDIDAEFIELQAEELRRDENLRVIRQYESIAVDAFAATGFDTAPIRQLLDSLGEDALLCQASSRLWTPAKDINETIPGISDRVLVALLDHLNTIALANETKDNPMPFRISKTVLQINIFIDPELDGNEDVRTKLIQAADIAVGGTPFNPFTLDPNDETQYLDQKQRDNYKVESIPHIVNLCESSIDSHGLAHDNSKDLSYQLALVMSNYMFEPPETFDDSFAEDVMIKELRIIGKSLGWDDMQIMTVFADVYISLFGYSD